MIERVAWDSEFFGYEVGTAKVEKDLNLDNFVQEAQNFQLVYIYCLGNIPDLPTNIHHIGTRINLKKKLAQNKSNIQIPFYSKEEMENGEGIFELYTMDSPDQESFGTYLLNQNISDDLVNLALLSGEFSRFKLDTRLSKNEYERLYSRWIQNAITGQDRVIIYKKDKNIIGLITLFSANTEGKIGLIAVAEEFRGQGIGNQLLQAGMTVGRQEGLDMLEIGTQKVNEAAMGLYQKVGFQVDEEMEVYHWWREETKEILS